MDVKGRKIMADAFTRSLGFEPGVQLNPTIDSSEGFAVNAVEDQTFGAVLRLPRGYIDRAFEVHKGNVLKVTGRPESVRLNPLNIAHTQLIEALNNGAKRAVVSRLVGEDAKNQWIVVSNYDGDITFSLADEPMGEFIFALKHHGCFNDGIRLSLSAKEKRNEADNLIDNDVVSLKILDSKGNLIDEFNGSLDLESTDDDGYPNSLQAIIAKFSSDDYEMVLSQNATIQTTSSAYGRDLNGIQKTLTSDVLKPFNEGTVTNFSALQYQSAVKQLKDSNTNFVYLTTLSSEATALCAALGQLAYEKNITLGIDIPNNLNPKQAIAWLKQLGLKNHLYYALWHPAECNDPNGISGRVKMGTSALRTAFACRRNAAINMLGFSRKQYAIAGREYPIQRQAIKQLYKPNDEELSDLAEAGITPVIFESFSGFSAYVFADAITLAGKATSYLNLISSVEIVSTIERDLSRIARQFLLYQPMEEAIRSAYRFCTQYLESATTSGWLVPSAELDGAAWQLSIQKNAQRPADVMNIDLKMHPEGCVRQVHITPEVTR